MCRNGLQRAASHINAKKCMAIKLGFRELADRETTLKLDNDPMSRYAEVNLSGVIKSGDLKWLADTRKTVPKCRIKVVLHAVQLRAFGATREDLLRIWTTFARPLLVNMQPRSCTHPSQTLRQSYEKEKKKRDHKTRI